MRLDVELKAAQAARHDLAQQLAGARDDLSRERVRQAALSDSNDQMTGQLAGVQATLNREQAVRADLLASNERLNSLLADTRDQMVRLAAALAASEATEFEQETVIGGLKERLTEALINRVEALERYRSEFFGRLREVLGDRPDVRVVGDRFVFQSEVLFASGSAELEPAGQAQLGQLAETLISISTTFPPDLPWVLRIDGHTDKQPISTPRFPSNWELSTGRAISVVRFLINRGIAADRLVAAGFGEHQPLDLGEDAIGYRRNRRIEIRLIPR